MYGVKRRDPMFMTTLTLMELEAFPTESALAQANHTLLAPSTRDWNL